jgi:hypothetical protein
LKGHFVISKIDPLIFIELVGQIVNQPQIEVLAAQMRVAVGGFNFKYAFTDLKN